MGTALNGEIARVARDTSDSMVVILCHRLELAKIVEVTKLSGRSLRVVDPFDNLADKIS